VNRRTKSFNDYNIIYFGCYCNIKDLFGLENKEGKTVGEVELEIVYNVALKELEGKGMPGRFK
jgi:hypothetical protein